MTYRLFSSFDLDHDDDLHDRLLDQLQRRGSMFEILGSSQRSALTDRWNARVRNSISAADEVVFICGEHTRTSEQMGAELRIAQEEGKPYVFIWGRREVMCTRPQGARRDDDIYSWTREIVEDQMVNVLRRTAADDVPESMKKP
jgi:hypothetical protein